MYKSFSKSRKNGARGQALAEYLPQLTTMGVFAIVILWALGGWVSDTFNSTNSCIETAAVEGRVASDCDADGVQTANSGNQSNPSNTSGSAEGGNEEPPAEEPPAEEPPAEEPPAEEPPAEEPPAEEPPAEEPPAEEPPAEEPPAEEPPAEEPPVVVPPTTNGHPDYDGLTDWPDSGVTTMRLSNGGSDSYVDAKFTGNVTGTYDGWCVDHEHGISLNRDYTVKLHGEDFTNLVDKEPNMDAVQWLINQDFQSNGYSVMDVQNAIWTLIDDQNVNPNPKAQQLVSLANQNGENFMPEPGGIIGLVVEPIEGDSQHIMVEVEIPKDVDGAVHVDDLLASSRDSGSGWRADVDVWVVDESGYGVEGVLVEGEFGAFGTKYCTTGADGECRLTSNKIGKTVGSVTLTIVSVQGGVEYDSSANELSSITVAKP